MIPDDHVTASSVWDDWHRAGNARLHFKKFAAGRGAWAARKNDKSQWLQVDLGSLAVITQIATQGRQNYPQWVRNYTISFSLDGVDFHTYENGKVLNRVCIRLSHFFLEMFSLTRKTCTDADINNKSQ